MSSLQIRRAARPAALVAIPAVAAVLAGCGARSAVSSRPSQRSSAIAVRSPELLGAELPRTRAPVFTLRDQRGQRVSLARQRGSYVVVAFLYTHCPDVCPLIASELNRALLRLRSSRHSLKVLAVSVDPRGDTPAAVRGFVARRRLVSDFRYLTGSRQQLERVWHAYNIATYEQGSGVVAHSTTELLIDPRGYERAAYPGNVTASEVVHDVRALARAEARG